MRGKIRSCLRWTKFTTIGIASAILTLVILFSISTPRTWHSTNYETKSLNSKKYMLYPENMSSILGNSQFLYTNETSSWIVLPGKVVVHWGVHPNPHNYLYVLNNPEICRSFDRKRLRLLIFIESDCRHHKKRKEIRHSWGLRMLQEALNFRLIFLLGRSPNSHTQELIKQEHYLYGDVVQENFTESFDNLGLKSIMGLKWSWQFCKEANFVMKSDDDIFIHLPNLIKLLTPLPPNRSLICHKNRVRKIIRRNYPLSKYEVLPKDLPGVYFPEYCAGFAYVMSLDVVEKLYQTSLVTPYFFIEDVFVTGFCRHKAQIELNDHPAITLRPHLTPAQASCAFSEGRVTSQELVDDELQMMWEQLNTQGYFCPQPVLENSKK